jgi:hypothetical protein
LFRQLAMAEQMGSNGNDFLHAVGLVMTWDAA